VLELSGDIDALPPDRAAVERRFPLVTTSADAVSFAVIENTKCTHVLGFDAVFSAAGFEVWTPASVATVALRRQ
jgi:hypothetical protein